MCCPVLHIHIFTWCCRLMSASSSRIINRSYIPLSSVSSSMWTFIMIWRSETFISKYQDYSTIHHSVLSYLNYFEAWLNTVYSPWSVPPSPSFTISISFSGTSSSFSIHWRSASISRHFRYYLKRKFHCADSWDILILFSSLYIINKWGTELRKIHKV